MNIQNVLIAGAGSIGIGVARSFAKAGFEVTILSRDPARFEGVDAGVATVSELPARAPDLIVESIPELASLKHELYARIENKYQGKSILASNTSGLPLEELSAPLRYPQMFLGSHYFYPADSAEFVEVVRVKTSEEVVAAVAKAVRRCGQTPVVLSRPIVGALFSRLQHAILREAYYLISEGYCTMEEVNDMARRFLAPRMCITGLLEQKDISGLDTHARAHQNIVPYLSHDPKPTRFLLDRYDAGHFGLKSGLGFYDWSGKDPESVRREVTRKVARISALMKEMETEAGKTQ